MIMIKTEYDGSSLSHRSKATLMAGPEVVPLVWPEGLDEDPGLEGQGPQSSSTLGSFLISRYIAFSGISPYIAATVLLEWP
jgi:hypothetical protein